MKLLCRESRVESRTLAAGAKDLSCPRRSTFDSSARRSAAKTARPEAFTLIELILVLALLAIVTSLAAPSLSSFFRGRALNSEARQLLSLTHAGQSRAISDGFPTLLWIDSEARAYGLQEEATSQTGAAEAADPKAEEFVFNENLQIEAINASPLSVNGRSLPAIRFLPDGTVDEDSPRVVRLTAQSGETLWLVQASNRLSYAISDSDK
jgi:type II secretion system protein H